MLPRRGRPRKTEKPNQINNNKESNNNNDPVISDENKSGNDNNEGRGIASGGPGAGAPQPRKKRQTFTWLSERAFDSEDEIRRFFEVESYWRKDTVKHLQSGRKTLYYCNQVGRSGIQCPAKINIWEKPDKTLHLMRNGMDHCHDADGQKKKTDTIDGAVMKKVEELVRLRIRPRAISHLIREDEGFPVKPSENQVSIIQ